MTPSDEAGHAFIERLDKPEHVSRCSKANCFEPGVFKVSIVRGEEGVEPYIIRYFCREHKDRYKDRLTGEITH